MGESSSVDCNAAVSLANHRQGILRDIGRGWPNGGVKAEYTN